MFPLLLALRYYRYDLNYLSWLSLASTDLSKLACICLLISWTKGAATLNGSSAIALSKICNCSGVKVSVIIFVFSFDNRY